MLLKFYIPLMLDKRRLRVLNAKLPDAHTTPVPPGEHTHLSVLNGYNGFIITEFYRNSRSKHTCNVIRGVMRQWEGT